MKFSTTSVFVGLAASAAADGWETWSSVDLSSTPTTGTTVTVCPSQVTSTTTTTKTVAEVTSEIFETTLTVKNPETKTVTVYADGKTVEEAWEAWKSTSSSAADAITSLPAGCVPNVVTTTKVESVKKMNSTTTMTKSTLFVGNGKGAKTTVTITATGSAATWGWGYASDSDSATASWGSDFNHASDSGNWRSDSGSWSGTVSGLKSASGTTTKSISSTSSKSASGTTSKPAAGSGSGSESHTDAAAASSDKIVATGADAFKWTVTPSSTIMSVAQPPVYTQKPDGTWGAGSDSWDDWNSPSDGGSGSNSGSGSNGGGSGSGSGSSSGSGSGSFGNSTTFGGNSTVNGTLPLPGTVGSNVTAPHLPLKEIECNTASDRSQWCGGKDINSDYYESYDSRGVCKYDLVITNTTLNHDGTDVIALAVNGQVPGPVIECNWGDMVSITVHNQLTDNGTAIHWHGIRQLGTNDMDGVPGITECPLAPGETRTYTWRASSYGTSWYHSHWATQYGDGVYGPIVIHGPATANYDIDAGVVAISDTFPATAAAWNVFIAHAGPQGSSNYLLNGHNTKPDLSAGQHSLWTVQKGKKYLFRMLNSAAQNMFSVSVDSHKMTVIAADFVPIIPYETEWLNIGIGQRYDVIIEMNQAVDSYFLRAVTQTQCPSTCDNTGLAQANGIIAYEGVQETPYLLPTSTVNGDVTIDNFNICDDEPLASLVPKVSKTGGSSDSFKAQVSTLPAGGVSQVNTTDDGLVFRWFINNGFIDMDFTQPTLKTLAEKGNSTLISNAITLPDANVWVYFVIQNQFFASHPMHLHGHDFSVLGQGSGVFDETLVDTLNFVNPMRRDTAMLKGALNPAVGVPGYTVIGFVTDNPGAWLMHCHIIWHVDGGLALEFLERPDEIATSQYVDDGYNDYCDAYSAYETAYPQFRKTSGESGLKRRSTFFDDEIARLSMGQFDSVVRRTATPEKRYLDSHALKRGIGHSRHFRR